MTQNKRLYVYHIIALCVIFVWGVTFVNTKVLLLHGMSAMEIFLVRFLLAYLCIWIISPRRVFADTLRDELVMVMLGVTGGSAYFLLENLAVKISYVNNVSFIVCCSAPILTMLLARVFVKDMRLSARLLTGSVIALVGIAIVIFNGKFVLHLNPLGDLLALAAGFCWAVYCLFIRGVSRRYNAAFITRKVFAYGLLTSMPILLFHPWQFPLHGFADPAVWGNLLFLGAVASFACFALWSLSIKHIGALATSNYVYLNPVTTVIASALVLNEPMTLMAYIGSALILFGVYLTNTHTRASI